MSADRRVKRIYHELHAVNELLQSPLISSLTKWQLEKLRSKLIEELKLHANTEPVTEMTKRRA